MFAFAKKLVNQLEQQATEQISNLSLNSHEADTYFKQKGSGWGLRVLSVERGSICANHGFESWFDFIVGVNDYEINLLIGGADSEENVAVGKVDYTRLLGFLKNLVDNLQPIRFQVWNAKGGTLRTITVPSEEIVNSGIAKTSELDDVSLEKPSNEGVVKNDAFKKLGMSLQYAPLEAATYVWHVLNVKANSPAYQAGLLPGADYIIGSQDGLLATGGEDLLGKVITSLYLRSKSQDEKKSQLSVILYAYNHDFDIVRPVTIYPNEEWGGGGLLGCDVGYGLLHRLPEVFGKFGEAKSGDSDEEMNYNDFSPGTTMFATPGETKPTTSSPLTSQTFVPASVAPPPHSSKSKRKPKHVANDLSSYFEEETKKSKEMDGSKAVTSHGDIPPPPSVLAHSEEHE